MFTFQAKEYGFVAAVALAGGAERAIELDFDAGSGSQQPVTAQAFDEACRGTHGADGMGAGGADADFEQVEHT
ncbi:hypothetical protein D3C76_1735300 [compost metagenome]